MQASIGRWGNSLALRLPADCVRSAGLKEGSVVQLDVLPTGELRLLPAATFDKAGFLKSLVRLHRQMPESAPVVASQRQTARY
jgi:antitoxin MazE